jgi:hypothetical protein
MRAKPVLFLLGSLPLLAACSFLLDFDSLQAGKKITPDAGEGGSEVESGSGGVESGSGGVDAAGAAGAHADARRDFPFVRSAQRKSWGPSRVNTSSDPRSVKWCSSCCMGTPGEAQSVHSSFGQVAS